MSPSDARAGDPPPITTAKTERLRMSHLLKSLTSILFATALLSVFNPAAFGDTDTSKLKELLSASVVSYTKQ